jgi:flagellin
MPLKTPGLKVRSTPGMNPVSGMSGWLGSLGALGRHQQAQQTALERLTTGKQINRASDDPAGMIAANDFKVRQNDINKLLDGFERETARLGAVEGGLSVLQDMLLDLSGLVVESASTGGLGAGEAEANTAEINGILQGINHVVQTTMFNGEQVLIGNTTDQLGRVIVDGEYRGLGELAAVLAKDPEAAQRLVDSAVDSVAGKRGAIGTRMRAIESEMDTLREEFAGNAGVLSRIEDADYAKESSELIRAQILEQATIKAIQVQRENAERVLDLIAGPAR